ncbi:MAG: AMP-binding protein [Nitrospiraceae bacterium]|nr:AMP-binding protein [Nitrospiraceae bacterium]
MNLRDISSILDAADDRKTAVLYEGGRFTYSELKKKINETCSDMKNFIEEGDRVIIRLSNTPESIIQVYAIGRLGGIPVPISPSLKSREIHDIANDVHANVMISEAGGKIIDPDDELHLGRDAAMVFYTSGTTGKPVGIVHTKDTILTTCRAEGEILGIQKDDVVGGTPPLSFTYGFGALAIIPFLFRATTYLSQYEPTQKNIQQIFETIERDQITVFYSSPTTYRLMLKMPKEHDLTSLRLLITAGETMGTGLYRRLKMFLPHAEIIEHLGCTESFHAIISNMPGNVKPGSLGLELPCYRAKILCDDGTECPPGVFGKLAFRGPIGRHLGETEVKEWTYTGDIAYRDSEGYIWYVSRSDDLIKTAGYLVSPHEVENVLIEHPAVSDVAVIGVADPMIGQRIKALAVLMNNFTPSKDLKEDIIEFLKGQIAEYKIPQDIEFFESIPKSNRGKMLRKRILTG